MIDQAEIHRKANSTRPKDRRKATELLFDAFSVLPDKTEAWHDLVRLTQDRDSYVRLGAAAALGSSFSQVPDRNAAWHDLRRLIKDRDSYVRLGAAAALGSSFSQIPDRNAAWHDLHLLTKDRDSSVRLRAAAALGSSFSQVPDKTAAWHDLHRLTQDQNINVRRGAARALGLAFSQVPDKAEAWQDLHRLIGDRDSDVQWYAARALGSAFAQVPDKAEAWQDLHRLITDQDSFVRLRAAEALSSAFSQVPYKAEAWEDLHRLILDQDNYVRRKAARALGSAFLYVPEKREAMQDLARLTEDPDSDVRRGAAEALGLSFSQVPDKREAWQDLVRLAEDPDSDVRRGAAEALGSSFSQVPDKREAWQDLVRLAKDQDSTVRMYAYHSLGKASVLKATEAENKDCLEREMKAAIGYFERSAQEASVSLSPAKFCLPFYRSYFAITFEDAKENEVKRYLDRAKSAVGISSSKAELIEAVENLARALLEAQRLKDRPLHEIAGELDSYRLYCEKAAEHMAAAEDGAPGVVKLMKTCNPFLEERIKATIAEIQEKAKQICQITHGSGTEYEVPGKEIYQAAEALSSVDLVGNEISSSIIVLQLMKFCDFLPNDEKGPVCKVVKEIELVSEFPEKLLKIALALSELSPILLNLLKRYQCLEDVVILTVLPEEYKAICIQLSSLSPLDLPPNMGSNPNIYAWKSGQISCPKYDSSYRVAVGMIGRAGNNQSALAAKEAISLWRPHYIIFSGIAGGLPHSGLKKGDVIIADCIYGYEYGKVEQTFKPRENWTYNTDQGLLNGTVAYSLQDRWRDRIKSTPPEECEPEVISGEIASGEKVVEDPTNEFFTQVLMMRPKVKAVEMEGAGIGSAIEQAQSLKVPVGFMVIRAISDLPRPKYESDKTDKTRGTKERDAWKAYASDVAACFIVGWISDGLPVRPSARS